MRSLRPMHTKLTNWSAGSRAPLVISLLALFFALGGTGWAGQVIGRGSVGTAQLARDAVTAPKIAAGAVTKSKLARGAVSSEAFGARVVGRDAIAPGAITADRIAPGILGGVSANKISIVTSPLTTIPNTGASTLVSVSCPAGQRVIGGGWHDENRFVVVTSSAPTLDGAGWGAAFSTGGNDQVTVQAICVAP